MHGCHCPGTARLSSTCPFICRAVTVPCMAAASLGHSRQLKATDAESVALKEKLAVAAAVVGAGRSPRNLSCGGVVSCKHRFQFIVLMCWIKS